MIRKMPLHFLAVSCLFCAPLLAQDRSARDRLFSAHAQYYTPTVSGLKSFHCDAAIDWKAMLTHSGVADVPTTIPASNTCKQSTSLLQTNSAVGGHWIGAVQALLPRVRKRP